MRLLLLCLSAGHVLGQSDLAFTWGFSSVTNQNLSQCGSTPIGIYGSGNSTAPYYAFTYPLNDSLSPSVQLVTENDAGTYITNYPTNTSLVLGVVDAFSRFGGWSSPLTVQSGVASTTCLSSIKAPTLKLTINATQLGQCDVAGIEVSGGTAPYTFTIFPRSGTTNTYNITTSSTDNYLSWVNNFGPGNQVGVGVRDSAGNWAPVGGPISLIGQAGPCSFSSTTSNGPPKGSKSGNDGGGGGGSNAGAIAGGVVGGLVALAAVIAAWWFWRRRKNQQAAAREKRFTYHAVAHTGRSSPQMSGVLPANAEPTPFSLSSTGGSQGHSPALSLGGTSQFADPSGTASSTGPLLGGFQIANPSFDSYEVLGAPSTTYAHHRSDSSGSRGPLPATPGPSSGIQTSKSVEAELAVGSDLGQRVYQSEDAGPLPHADEPEEIPPAYTGIGKGRLI